MSPPAVGEAVPVSQIVVQHASLERRLGTVGLSVHYVASVLGAGVLILPGIALQTAGPASVVAWAILIGFSYLFAWVLAQLSVKYADCHGLPLFIRNAFGQPLERGAALLLGLAMAGGIIPVYGIAAARRLASLGVVPPHWPPSLVAVAVVLAAVTFGLAGLRLGARVQIGLVGVVVAVLLLTVGLAAPYADPANLAAPVPEGWRSIGMAVAICFFAVIGWENAAPMAEEVRDPEQTVPRAAMLGVTLVGFLYLAFAATLVLTVPVSGSQEAIAPVSAMLSAAVGEQGQRLGDLLSLALILIAANAWVLAASRLVCGLARRRMLPRTFSVLSGESRTPVQACLLVGATATAMLLVATPLRLGEHEIISATSSTFLVIYILVIAAALRLLDGRVEKVVSAITLAVLLVMGSFYAVATLLTALFLLACVVMQRLSQGLTTRT